MVAAANTWPGLGSATPTMEYRRLGRTNMKISAISLGGSPVPPEAVFRRAIEMGVNYVDTSSSYMNGNSELTIAKVRKEFPGRLFVATKFHAGRRGHPHSALEKEFEGSLKRLNMDCVDILMIHGAASPQVVQDEFVLNLLQKFKKQGKIRFAGVSCHRNPVEVLTPAIRGGQFDMITVAYSAFSGNLVEKGAVYGNYLERSGIEGIIELAAKHDVGVVAMKTMAGGSRQDLTEYKKRGISLPQAKLKWVLENPAVAAAITEMVTFDILEENLAAGHTPLQAGEKKALLGHVIRHSGHTCRMCGQCISACPQKIAIPDILRYSLYYHEHGKRDLAKNRYRQLPPGQRANDCTGCNICTFTCPHQLPIPHLLHASHAALS
jgi:predicted aldo/keto reductase-like oxidoreductase